MNKNSKWLLAAACLGIAMGAMVGCNQGEDNSSSGEPQNKIELNLTNESVVLELFEEYELSYDYTGEEALSWIVGDASIVSVVNGKLVALKEGETTVTVQVGELSDVCTVKVNGMKAELLNISANASQISLYAGDNYTIEPKVLYGTKHLSDATFSYESSNSSIVEVSPAGVLTAKTVGDATIIITGNALGSTVGCMVNVSVATSGKIVVNNVQAELYV